MEQRSDSNGTDAMAVCRSEWQAIVAATPPALRAAVSDIVRQHSQELSQRFYAVMMQNPDAGGFLDHQLVETRLRDGMTRWLSTLFAIDVASSIDALIAHQQQVGGIHARIKIPFHLVGRGARHFKHWIWEFLEQDATLSRSEMLLAHIYVNDMMDIAIDVMSDAFLRDSDGVSRTDEAYKLFSLNQDLAIERERQRAALLEWSQQMLYSVHRRELASLPRLAYAEFGLWLVHKADFMFEQSAELYQIMEVVERIDSQVVSRFLDNPAPDTTAMLLVQLEAHVSEIKFLLTALFDRYLELENGRDVLTRLFNRRFLSSALMREIDLAKRKNRQFAVMLVDIDHFKQVNDSHGHDAGDMVLQQTALLIMNSVRSGDFVFRYGGEEILVILVDVGPETAAEVAESLRAKIETTSIFLNGSRSVHITVSIGIAAYDGHPDYQQLVARADKALYVAKNAGRNRCQLA